MRLQQISTDIFGQLTAISEQLTPDQFSQPLDLLFGASIGKHVRHVLECYAIALTGYRTSHVNYGQRVRQTELENNPRVAIETMTQLADRLQTYTDDRILCFEASYSTSADPDVTITTTFFRELLYNIEHAIHHSAIIRIGLEKMFPHVCIPANFGIAYATVQHQSALTHTPV